MKKTVFYVDDDEDDLYYFKHAVKKINADIDLKTFSNSDVFLSSISSKAADESIVFLDINMPGKNGFQVLQEIRQINGLKEIPVIMYSTSNEDYAISTSKEMGADLYAVKPNDINLLQGLLKRIFNIDWNKFIPGQDNFIISV